MLKRSTWALLSRLTLYIIKCREFTFFLFVLGMPGEIITLKIDVSSFNYSVYMADMTLGQLRDKTI